MSHIVIYSRCKTKVVTKTAMEKEVVYKKNTTDNTALTDSFLFFLLLVYYKQNTRNNNSSFHCFASFIDIF